MALATACQTPGATYRTKIAAHEVIVEVDLGRDELVLGEESAALLEANLHNAVELVLSRFYRLDQINA